jgi:L-seryl-tRNA(Ser) seleniumtransferase
MEALQAHGIPAKRQKASGYVGGGAIPETAIPTEVVILERKGISDFVRQLRSNEPSVVGRIHEDALCLDLRTVSEDEISLLANCVAQCWTMA